MTDELPRPVSEVPPSEAEGRSVVGYDGSSAASVALQWAAQRARRSGTPLVVLSAVDDVRELHAGRSAAGLAAAGLAAEGAALAEAAGADATPVSVLGGAAAALVGVSARAESVVVARAGSGTHRAGLPGLVARPGRVAFSVVDGATSPVVLVRGAAHAPGPDHPVVVGLDGSASSERAARFAAGEAVASGARLVLVAVWGAGRDARGGSVRTTAWHPGAASEGAQDTDDDAVEPAEQEALARLAAATAVVREVAPALLLERRSARGVPSEVLLDPARGAGLLVLGARGTQGEPGAGGGGGDRAGRLGATALELLSSSPCPVAVVP